MKLDKQSEKMLSKLNFKELPSMMSGQVQKMFLDLYQVENMELYLRLKVANTCEKAVLAVNDGNTLDFYRGYAKAHLDMIGQIQKRGLAHAKGK
jgi:hypothetical protein